MKMQCRRLSAADLPAVAVLEAQVQIEPWSSAQLLGIDHELGAQYHGWVMQDEQGLICAYVLMQNAVDEAELLTIGVAIAHQGLGIGYGLWQHAWADLRHICPQVNTCFLEVRASNLAAQALYARCGFLPVGRRRNYYGQPDSTLREDALILKKNNESA